MDDAIVEPTRRSPRRKKIETAPVEGTEATIEIASNVESKAPERPAMRRVMRDEDPRVAAEKRAAAILDHLGEISTGTDDFYVDPSAIPAGWTYEWKRHTLLGKEDPSYQVQLARTGWEPVPASRHPEMMPSGNRHAIIERKGMILMERPESITVRFRAADDKHARDQVRTKQEQLAVAKEGTFERQNKDAPLAKIRHSYEPLEIPAG